MGAVGDFGGGSVEGEFVGVDAGIDIVEGEGDSGRQGDRCFEFEIELGEDVLSAPPDGIGASAGAGDAEEIPLIEKSTAGVATGVIAELEEVAVDSALSIELFNELGEG